MKKFVFLLMVILSVSLFAGGDEALGKWITEKAKNGNQIVVEIYRGEDGKYNGRIDKLTMPVYTEGEYAGQEKMDLKNPDENLRHRILRGIDFVSGFDYDEKEHRYVNGNIYVPTTGKTYYSYMELRDDGTLFVKGSIDKGGLFGKKQIWKRYE